jgi:DHA1 family bicyclomycin/chloramphenicol resistance-like MFS transporter
MGFASISTDLDLSAVPVMGRALPADVGMVEWTISGYLIGFSLDQLLWAQSATVVAARVAVFFLFAIPTSAS